MYMYIHSPPTTNQPTQYKSLDIVICVDLTCTQDVWVNVLLNINLVCENYMDNIYGQG